MKRHSIKPYEQPARAPLPSCLRSDRAACHNWLSSREWSLLNDLPSSFINFELFKSDLAFARSHDSSSIESPSSTTRLSEPTDYNRIVNAVIEKIAMSGCGQLTRRICPSSPPSSSCPTREKRLSSASGCCAPQTPCPGSSKCLYAAWLAWWQP